MPASTPRARCSVAGSRADDLLAIQQDAAGRIAAARRQQLQQRKRGHGLAGAGFAYQRKGLAAVQGERHITHDALGAEGDGQVFDLDEAHAVIPAAAAGRMSRGPPRR